jgi:hypothetical protein
VNLAVYSPMHALILAAALFVQATTSPASLRAHRADTPPTIDGRLDERVWQSAEVATDFHQYEPTEGAVATERTEVRVLYDNSSLFVGVRLFDKEPNKIVTRLSRRDDDPDADRMTFYVDALHDHLTGASFEVSAAGAQRDSIISNDINTDSSWDAVWDAKVSIDDEGWNVEMRIPLSQLRFLKADRQTWGFNVERFIYRKNERDWFLLVPKKENGLASRMANLMDIDGIEPHSALEITPYTVFHSEYVKSPLPGNPFNDGSRYFGTAGFDVKFPLRSNVILNATVNPDFGQVEIDPAVVNLGAFETFFPEKRPFFIEGAQIFSNFGYLGANNRFGFNRSDPILIHTRRIGRPPEGTADGDFVDMPSNTTILGAAKLTGKTNSQWSFGILEALTEREYASAEMAGQRSRTEVEPLTNYFAGRLLKEFNDGHSGVGAIVTSVNRQFRDPALKDLLRWAWPTSRGSMVIIFSIPRRSGWLTGSWFSATLQETPPRSSGCSFAPQRYFQRTETPEVSFDPNRTSMRGWSGDINLNRNQGAWSVNTALWAASPGFESDDLGFHFNGDVWGNHVAFSWKQIKPDRFTRDRNITVAKFYVWDYGNAKVGDGAMSFANLTFNKYWNMGGNIGLFRKVQDDRLTRGGPPSLELPNGFTNMYLNSDSRKRIVLHFNGGRSWSDSGGGSGDGSFSVEWKPSPRVNLSTGPSYSHNINAAQYVTTVDDAAAVATHGKRYVFARLQQKQLSMDTRVNMLFTPKASLQVFMQPLVVVGDYVDFKSLTAPKTFSFDPYPNVSSRSKFQFQIFAIERDLSLGMATRIDVICRVDAASVRISATPASSSSAETSAVSSRVPPITSSSSRSAAGSVAESSPSRFILVRLQSRHLSDQWFASV